jgi:hypothetical protein
VAAHQGVRDQAGIDRIVRFGSSSTRRACPLHVGLPSDRCRLVATTTEVKGQLRKSRSLSDASQMDVTFDRELPAGRAEIPPIGGVCAYGGASIFGQIIVFLVR